MLPPLLAPLHLDLLYPLLAGYAFGPGMALATGVVGLLFLQWFLILFARGNLNLLAIAAPRLIEFLAQEGFIPSFKQFFAYFFTQIPLIFQFLVWAVVCLVVGSLARRRHFFFGSSGHSFRSIYFGLQLSLFDAKSSGDGYQPYPGYTNFGPFHYNYGDHHLSGLLWRGR
ncbi:hypothetical protein [Candidatus Hakubella thermalkaliphila]|uniref:hypothetical protein n=1 Tax=Candidatus Hakubella thermalkaliphila TaxID=2754717 RepID=UPI0015941BAB|nr:hypothetical protein [Candidatus Hakubella thermalkaliphila]